MASKKQLKKRIRKLKRQLKKSKASYYDLYEIHSEWDEERWMENKGLMDRIAELEARVPVWVYPTATVTYVIDYHQPETTDGQ